MGHGHMFYNRWESLELGGREDAGDAVPLAVEAAAAVDGTAFHGDVEHFGDFPEEIFGLALEPDAEVEGAGGVRL